jgi:hypothetical protein
VTLELVCVVDVMVSVVAVHFLVRVRFLVRVHFLIRVDLAHLLPMFRKVMKEEL